MLGPEKFGLNITRNVFDPICPPALTPEKYDETLP